MKVSIPPFGLLSRYYSAGRVDLRRQYGELPPVSCFASQLNQVWMNLLVNAAQAIRDRGTVTISTRRDGNSVEVAISDTGSGIPRSNSHAFSILFLLPSRSEKAPVWACRFHTALSNAMVGRFRLIAKSTRVPLLPLEFRLSQKKKFM